MSRPAKSRLIVKLNKITPTGLPYLSAEAADESKCTSIDISMIQ